MNIDIEEVIMRMTSVDQEGSEDHRNSLINMFKECEIKSELKIIDLSIMVGKNVDMEFQSKNDSSWAIGKLDKILYGGKYPYFDNYGESWSKCRVREDHWHDWQGGECPLPIGLIIKIKTRDNNQFNNSCINYNGPDWGWSNSSIDIISFKVVGIRKGYSYA